MKSIVCIFAVLALAHADTILQGPSARASLVGPDGSAISSVAPGGTVVADSTPGVVASTLPVVHAPVVAAAPLIARSAWAPSVVAHHGVVAPAWNSWNAWNAPIAW